MNKPSRHVAHANEAAHPVLLYSCLSALTTLLAALLLAAASTSASAQTDATATASARPPRYETLPAVPPLPALAEQGHVEHAGARIWYGIVGHGSPVILLHGGRASSLGWGHQVRALVARKHRVILIDSRGHGRSTLGERPLSYALMAQDVAAVMDRLELRRAAVAGWSDGAIVGLELSMRQPQRVSRLFAFGPNVNQRHIEAPLPSPVLPLIGPRLRADYEAIAPDPQGFMRLGDAVAAMQAREPDYTDAQLAALRGPAIAIAAADHDEFITMRHFKYAAAAIPGARLLVLRKVSHFAPWQDPAGFNEALLDFLNH
ncbi:alpha/beta hydrolase [Massilia sp. CFBP9012]|uniref:alpha/beta fold hydrolase n=1 Tax=Massilia sp. CFBP9012 TaxID=3096531 RepID=UPI002A6B088C|nr:alpha/beta hydrolase [Massilia sp. CFBP9012]MDY0977745.1 alpha/beta hydrolase [Massilia sp. CFBP9012]